jgi:PAS domain S-box-containing protein
LLSNLLFPFLIALLNLSIAALVYSRNRHHSVNRSFAAFASSVAGWTFSTALSYHLAGTQAGLFWGRSAFLLGATSAAAMLAFCHVFPFRERLMRPPLIQISHVSTPLVGLLSLSPWIVYDVHPAPQGVRAVYGPLYPLFAIHILFCLAASLTVLTRRTLRATGLERQQLRYLFVAIIIPGILATTTNVIFPIILGHSRFGQYGPLFSLVMVAMIAHAIIRHRIMDVRLVIRGGVVYLAASAIAATFFITAIGAVAAYTPGHVAVPLAVQVLLAIAIALTFEPLKAWIQNRLDQYVYRQTYDYQQVVRDASRHISGILNIDDLTTFISEMIYKIFRPDFVAVFILDANTSLLAQKAYRPSSPVRSPQNKPITLHLTQPLPLFLATSMRPLLKETPSTAHMSAGIAAARRHLEELQADCAVPMLSERTLVGILALGPKLAGDPYFVDDLELLTVLANQAAIAVNNATLFEQVVLVKDHIENILSTMDSGVIAVDKAGRLGLFNATAERLTGLSRSRLPSLSLAELPHVLASQLERTLADGVPRQQVELSLSRVDTHEVPIVASTVGLRDRHGVTTGALIVFSDVSKLKELETEKRRAERLGAFSTLVSGIAHEIKNPLVAIRTFAELLPERFLERDFREDFSKVVITEIDRIDDLVARLRGLAVSTPSARGLIDIREPILDTLALLRGQLEQNKISVLRDTGDDQFLVPVDSPQLKQLFLNVFLNAVEAIGEEGIIHIRLDRRASPAGSTVVVEVSDTGPGIPEAIRSHVFDPFFTTKSRGSGLGLAICRGITDAHRGSIRAEPGAGRYGTRIVIEFPAAEVNLSATGQEAILDS